MKQTEQDAKRLLIEQLDSSLLDHAAALGQKEGGPDIVDVYKRQGLAELHYYLKVEHEFTAAEVEALLQFADPLVVAQNCWEENSCQHSFPICELLNEINASQRFPQKEPVLSAAELKGMVKEAMKQEYMEYREAVLQMSKEEIFRKSAEIAAMRDALDFVQHDYSFEPGDAETFLDMEKPLSFVADLWPTEIGFLLDMSTTLSEALETEKEYQKTAVQESTRSEKASVREQLQAAMQEVNRRPPQEDKPYSGDAR